MEKRKTIERMLLSGSALIEFNDETRSISSRFCFFSGTRSRLFQLLVAGSAGLVDVWLG